jgi:predicted O-methyltransferase YrrM/MoaA/NifB/PqqE/SkfB family radical SAM enzyme
MDNKLIEKFLLDLKSKQSDKAYQVRFGNLDPSDGRFLRMLVEIANSKNALEIGTANGISALWLSLGLLKTGGKLTTIEIDPESALAAKETWKMLGIGPTGIIKIIEGDALKVIPTLQEKFDFVFLDAYKPQNFAYFKALIPLLLEGSLILAHDVLNEADNVKDYIAFVQGNPYLDTYIVDVADCRGLAITYVRNPQMLTEQAVSQNALAAAYGDVSASININRYMELIKHYVPKHAKQPDMILGDEIISAAKKIIPKNIIDTPPFKVFFTWEITYECNYHCTYCHAPKPWNPQTRKTRSPGLRKWIEIWRKIYDDYGECEMVISGGEPFIYPNFMELMSYLSEIHIIEFCTNLFFDVEQIVNKLDPKRVRVGTSFHPEYSELEFFIKKINLLKDRGFETWVNFVPWPPFFPQIADIKNVLQQNGIKIVLQPFIGRCEGRQYPQGYTDKEKKVLGIFNDKANIKAVDFKTTDRSDKRGKLCRMGENYAFIHPDGEVERCCKDHGINLGNIIDGTFKLLTEPAPCRADECNCWRCMLVETEPEWVKYWGRPERK